MSVTRQINPSFCWLRNYLIFQSFQDPVLQQQNITCSVNSEHSVLHSQRDNINPFNTTYYRKMRVGFFSAKKKKVFRKLTSWSRECHEYLKAHMELNLHMCLRSVKSVLCFCRYFHNIWLCVHINKTVRQFSIRIP